MLPLAGFLAATSIDLGGLGIAGAFVAALVGAFVAFRKSRPEIESITVQTARELVEGVRGELTEVRKQLGKAEQRVAALEATLDERDKQHTRELEVRDDALHQARRKIGLLEREVGVLRALIAGREPTRRDDPDENPGDDFDDFDEDLPQPSTP